MKCDCKLKSKVCDFCEVNLKGIDRRFMSKPVQNERRSGNDRRKR